MEKDKRILPQKSAMEELADILEMPESQSARIKELEEEGRTLAARRLSECRSSETLRGVQEEVWNAAKARVKSRVGL